MPRSKAVRVPLSRRGRAAALLALAVIISACSVLPDQPRPERTFQLVPPLTTHTVQRTGPSLLVDLPEAATGYRSDAMIYRRSPLELQAFASARWADSPAHMLAEAAASTLEDSGRFSVVATAPAVLDARYRLGLTLVRLEQDYTNGLPGVAHITVQARLINARSGEVIDSTLLDRSAPAEAAGPEPAAQAASVATRALLADLTRFVVDALPTRHPAPK